MQPHRRYNPLTREWVLVSAHRTDRPWQGERIEVQPRDAAPPYDPQCYLCPGNLRAGGERNPQYRSTFVFTNDFPALIPDGAGDFDSLRSLPDARDSALFTAERESGTCRVVCFSPRHDLHFGSMSDGEISGVVDCWANQYDELARLPFVGAVTIFENRGAMMGASNPHPHGQIWAESAIPGQLAKESDSLDAYRREHGDCLLCVYASEEVERAERIVYVDDLTTALVPFWATWPFEVLLIGRAHRGAISDLGREERAALARAMREVTSRYDRLFGVAFPYSMGFHQRPCGGDYPNWHLHAHYYPPLLRSATVRKYMVGYEMLAQPQRDLTAEAAAQRLRDA